MPTSVVVAVDEIAPANAGFRNRIINGNLDLWQRGTSFPIANNSAGYTADRFQAFNNVTAATLTAAKVGPPSGFRGTTAIGLTASAVAVSGAFGLVHRFEGRQLADLDGQDCVLSFDLAASTSAGALSGSISIATNATLDDGTFATNPSLIAFTLPSVAAPVEVAIPAAAMVGASNGLQVGISFVQATAAGNVSVTIGALQFERGRTANLFEFRPFPTEAALCRYFFCTASSRFDGYASNGVPVSVRTAFPVPMRITPTIVPTNTTNTLFGATPGVLSIGRTAFISSRTATGTGAGSYVESFTADAEL